jgi:electron transport complex protein RnfC
MGLEPYLIEKQAEYTLWEEAEKEDAADCMECGCCQFTCPAARPLLDNVRLAKANVMRIRRERSKK